MKTVQFGRYRATPATVWRPPRPTFNPQYRLSDAVFNDLRAVERADHELRRHILDGRTHRRLLHEALTRNAFGTASIEGNPLTLEEVESLLAREPTRHDPKEPDEREILNYARLMEDLPRRRPPRDAEGILDLHAELFRGVLRDAGTFKTRPNFIGRRPQYEVTFVPAMPERVRPELENALNWNREAAEHPLVRAIVFFHEFQSIHPFRDGNGRAGRALATLQLFHGGYTGIRYALVDYEFNADRDGYYGALAHVERTGFDYTPWIAYMASVLRRTFEGAAARMRFREGLPPTLNDRQVELAEWFARLARERPQRQVKFNDVHATFPAVAERTLKRDLAVLRDVGLLDMQGERKGARYRLRRV
jgi:Fic family protein